jgi:putative nucleotidyltransferase with HDIG domain
LDESTEEAVEKKTLVLAQKEPQDQRFLTALLSTVGGFEVVGAMSASGVIRGLLQSPDLILVDPHVRGNFMRALELMRRMPKLNHVAIAALTGDYGQAERCAGKGFNGFISKPFRPESILAKVWKILDSAPPLPGDGGNAALNVEVDNIEGLPTLPTVYAQVEQKCADPNVSADQLAEVIETDPSITMKLLKLSNSAFFGFSREIKSIRDAVSLLGNETVKNAVLSISVFEATKDQEESAGLDKKEFWRHSTAVGSAARFIAKKMRIQREEAFTAGILHDIGKIILDGLYCEFYEPILKSIPEKQLSLFEAESAGLQLNHASLGKELAESWKIPPRLIEPIAHHHTPKSADLDPEIANLVHIGNACARNLGFGSGGDPYTPVIDDFAMEHLAVSGEDILGWEEELVQTIENDMSFLAAIS